MTIGMLTQTASCLYGRSSIASRSRDKELTRTSARWSGEQLWDLRWHHAGGVLLRERRQYRRGFDAYRAFDALRVARARDATTLLVRVRRAMHELAVEIVCSGFQRQRRSASSVATSEDAAARSGARLELRRATRSVSLRSSSQVLAASRLLVGHSGSRSRRCACAGSNSRVFLRVHALIGARGVFGVCGFGCAPAAALRLRVALALRRQVRVLDMVAHGLALAESALGGDVSTVCCARSSGRLGRALQVQTSACHVAFSALASVAPRT